VDPIALTGLALALGATAWAVSLARSPARTGAALALLVLAAVSLRAPPAARLGISPWDERFHALVAKHALDAPLVPTLIEHPIREPAPDDWRHARVWLHKPPLVTWLIAGSFALFGVNELALRVPSVLLSSALVLVVFALARRFTSREAALLAAGLAAWHGRSLLLAAGLRATDHVDVGMTFFVALGALAAVRAAESLGRDEFWRRVGFTGAATAAAYYAKETPAVVVPAVLFGALAARGASWRVRVTATGVALGVALLFVLPWQLYVANAFPELAAVARGRGRRYFTTVVDTQGGPWWFHLANLPLDFGWLAPAAVAWLGVESLRARPELRPLALWLALVYGAFTLAATKMPSYVLIAAPAVFVALAWFALDALPRGLHRVVLLVLAANVAVEVWRVEEPFEPKARDPLWARELRYLADQVEHMPPGKRLVFVGDSPIECMFYTRATCVLGEPTLDDLQTAREKGFATATYGVPPQPGSDAIARDPSAEPARRLAEELQRAGVTDALVFNAREEADLRAYLTRVLEHASVSRGLPEKSRWLERKLASGARVVVLLPPRQQPPESLRAVAPDVLFLEDATYARRIQSRLP
jgi:4-amino-4-deoxy-L-arabinose transferase